MRDTMERAVWSWTDNLETAKFFANRTLPIQSHPYVYKAVVEPERRT
jgi:hypothetical protein